MIILFHDRIVMRLHHIVAPDDGTDAGAGRQLDVLDGFADHFGFAGLSVCDRFYRLCFTPPLRMDRNHITLAHMREQ